MSAGEASPAKDPRTVRSTVAGWIQASFMGWLLGLVAIVVLAMIADSLGGQLQLILGLGMGIGVGFVQGRFLDDQVASPTRWLRATVVGLGAPFLAWDVASLTSLESLFDAPRCILLGGLLAGVLQCPTLRLRSGDALLWVAVSLAAWGLPAGVISLGDSGLLPAPLSALLALGTCFFGGVLVGSVSAWPLSRLLEAAPQRAASG